MIKKLFYFILLINLFALSAFSQSPSDKPPMNAQEVVLRIIQLDELINGKKIALEKEKNRNFKIFDDEYRVENDKLSKMKKDEFETTKEFNARVETKRIELSKILQEKKDNYIAAVYNVERDKNIASLETELENLISKKYDLSNKYYNLLINNYNADGNYYDVTFKYYVRTVLNKETNKNEYIWDTVTLKWEIEREKAKEINSYKSSLILNCQASIFKYEGKYIVDKYEISITDPKTKNMLYSYVFYKNKKLFTILTDYASNTYMPTISNLRLRKSPVIEESNVIRLLDSDEKLQIVQIGKEDVISGNKGSWVKVKSLTRLDEGWCFSYFLTIASSQSSSFLLNIKSIIASSTLNSENNRYDVKNLFDGTYRAWSEGAEGGGIGENIIIYFNSPITVSSLYVWNGIPTDYLLNNRIKELDINGQRIILADQKEMQHLKLNNTITGDKLTLTIKSVYAGSKWNDTCITEISFEQKDIVYNN